MPAGVQRQLRMRRRHLPPAVRLGGAGRAAAVFSTLPRAAYLPPWPSAASTQVLLLRVPYQRIKCSVDAYLGNHTSCITSTSGTVSCNLGESCSHPARDTRLYSGPFVTSSDPDTSSVAMPAGVIMDRARDALTHAGPGSPAATSAQSRRVTTPDHPPSQSLCALRRLHRPRLWLSGRSLGRTMMPQRRLPSRCLTFHHAAVSASCVKPPHRRCSVRSLSILRQRDEQDA